MRNIFISVDKLGRVVCDGEQLGFSGEHNAVTVTVEFAEDAESFNSAQYFRFITDGRYSDELFLTDNALSFTLPQECMIPPEVGCQIAGYTVDSGEPTVIVKTEVFKLKVDYSEIPCEKLHSEPDVFERAMEKCRVAALTSVESAAKASNSAESAARSEQVCTEKSALAQTSAQSAYDSALSAVESAQVLSKVVYEVNNVANALKGSASGSVVAIKDVSPLEHDIKVKVSGEGIGNTGLTKTQVLSEQWDGVTLDTPAETVRVTFSEGNHYCAAGIIPLVDGQDLATLSDFSGLAIQPVYSYGEQGGVTDITYTINGNVLSWQGTKSFPESDLEAYEVSGSYTLSSSGQKITGFCQVYGLNEDNPFYDNPEEDSITVTVEVYEESSVGVVVYGDDNSPVKYFANADGTVDGIKSIYPSMTFEPDTEGVIVSVEYNRDTNKAIESIGDSAEGAVLYTEQTLTEEQKTQARENIGAIGEETLDSLVIDGYEREGKYVDILDRATKHTGAWAYSIDGKTMRFVENPIYNYYVMPVSVGETYYIESAHSPYIHSHYFVRGDNEVVEVGTKATGTMVVLYTGEITVPEGAEYLYINETVADNMIRRAKIQTKVATLHFVRTEVNVKSDYLYGKRLVACGDSITDGYDLGTGSGYVKNYAEIVAERHGMTFVKNAVSGSTMAYNEGGSSPVSTYAFSNTRYLNLQEFDYLTIWFGWNDATYSQIGTIDDTDNTTFYGAYKIVLNHLITNYPTKKIGLVVPYGNSSVEPFRVAVRNISDLYGVPCLDLADSKQCSLLWGTDNDAQLARRSALTFDGTHPNQAGHEYLSTMYEAFIKRL